MPIGTLSSTLQTSDFLAVQVGVVEESKLKVSQSLWSLVFLDTGPHTHTIFEEEQMFYILCS